MSYNQESGGNGINQTEVNLIIAIIVQAFKDINHKKRYKGMDKKARIEVDRYMAKKWIESDSIKPMSFVWYCSLLGLDHELIRNKGLGKSLRPSIRRSKLTS